MNSGDRLIISWRSFVNFYGHLNCALSKKEGFFFSFDPCCEHSIGTP